MMDAILAGAGGYLINDIKGMELCSRSDDGFRTVAVGQRCGGRVDGPDPVRCAASGSPDQPDRSGTHRAGPTRQIGERMFLTEKTEVCPAGSRSRVRSRLEVVGEVGQV